MTTNTYQVTGMTCGHCQETVTNTVLALGGVTAVDVDLETGQVTVTSEAPLDTDHLRTVIDDAGFELVS